MRRFPDCRDDLLASATVSLLPAGALAETLAESEPGAAASTRSRYRILRLHARGGLGEILTARDEDLHREVALKRLQPRLAGAAESRGRFLREAEITSQLEHPGVVPVYGLGQTADGSPVYAMRFIRGETFQEAVDRFHAAASPTPLAREAGVRATAEQRMAFRRLLARFVSVCNTVAYAHSRGILHRDLKPGNILLGEYGETLVVDWGLAKPVGGTEAALTSADQATSTPAADWTQAGEVIGTPAYMSPEQADGRWDVVGPASDVYSLGATLYVLLTGRPPFGPGLVGEVLEKVRRGDLPPAAPGQERTLPLSGGDLSQGNGRRGRSSATPTALALGGRPGTVAGRRAGRRPARAGQRLGFGAGPADTPRWSPRPAVVLAAGAVVAVTTALWFAAADREHSAKAVADVRQQALDRADRERYLFHAAAAGQEWWAAEYDLAAQHLAECTRPELRGWEWNYLTRCVRDRDGQTVLTLRGHEKEVWSVAFSPDGKALASASLDGTARVWDAADGRLLFKIEGHNGPVWGVAFSPDGAVLASGGDDGTVRLWDAKTGRPLRAFEDLAGEVHGIAFSRDGKLLAAAVMNSTHVGGEVRLWEVRDWTAREPLRIANGGPTSVAFSPDGDTVAAGTTEYMVRRWDLAAAKELKPLTGQKGPVRAVAFSPDGLWIAAAANDGRLGVWNAHTGAVKFVVLGHYAPAWGVAFSPDGRRIATSADDATIRIWDVASGCRLFTLYGHSQGIANVVFSPDGSRLASASDDQTVKVWNPRPPNTAVALLGHKNSVRGVAFSPDGKLLASAGDDDAVRVWDADAGRGGGASPLRTLDVPGGAHGVAFGAAGRLLAAAGGDGTIRVWHTQTGWEEHVLRGHDDKVLAVAFSPDGRLIASASADHTVKLWDAATWTEVRTLRGHTDAVRAVAFSPDGRRLASGGDDKTVKVWDAATGAEQRTLSGCPAAVHGVAFSPDGKRLAAGAAAFRKALTTDLGEILIWDPDTGQTVLTMRGHAGDVRALTYSPDGKRLVSAGADWQLIFWEPTTGQEILAIHDAHVNCINAVAFSPDGGRLASASCDQTVILWEGTPPDGGPK